MKYLIYLLTIVITTITIGILNNYLYINSNITYSFSYNILALIGYICIGFLISIKVVSDEWKRDGKWTFDKERILFLFIPSIILSIIPFEKYFIWSNIDITYLQFNNSIIFGILSGYIIATSLYKEDIYE